MPCNELFICIRNIFVPRICSQKNLWSGQIEMNKIKLQQNYSDLSRYHQAELSSESVHRDPVEFLWNPLIVSLCVQLRFLLLLLSLLGATVSKWIAQLSSSPSTNIWQISLLLTWKQQRTLKAANIKLASCLMTRAELTLGRSLRPNQGCIHINQVLSIELWCKDETEDCEIFLESKSKSKSCACLFTWCLMDHFHDNRFTWSLSHRNHLSWLIKLKLDYLNTFTWVHLKLVRLKLTQHRWTIRRYSRSGLIWTQV